MAEANETIADIIAEMRHKDTARRRFTLTDAFGGYETITIDRANTMLSLADRLEAALKRERGRNFHRFATAEEAAKAWSERKFKDLCVVCAGCTFDRGPEECAPGANCEIGWLYAEAQEGGAK